MATPAPQIQEFTAVPALNAAKDEVSVEVTSGDEFETYRREFLSRFSAEDDRRIMRKVDKRFLLLMGFMYLLKQIDFTNAASVKVLQVGLPSNIMKELKMSTNDYNWTQTIYYVRIPIPQTPNLLSGVSTFRCGYLTTSADWTCHIRSTQQFGSEKDHTPQMDGSHLLHLGNRSYLSCCDTKQRRLLRRPFPPRRTRSRLLPRSRSTDV